MRFTKAGASFLLLAVTVVLLVPGMLFAQSATKGAVSGTVTDTSGAILPVDGGGSVEGPPPLFE